MEFNSFFSFCLSYNPTAAKPRGLNWPQHFDSSKDELWSWAARKLPTALLLPLQGAHFLLCSAVCPGELHTWARLPPGTISRGQMFPPFCYILISQVGGKSRCYHTCIYKISSFSRYSERNRVLYWWLDSICRFPKYRFAHVHMCSTTCVFNTRGNGTYR